MLKEFKEFAFKGNAVDMAIGVVIGAAFGSIVSSLVDDLIMPIIGFITAGKDFSALKIVLSPAEYSASGELIKEEAAIMYGNFINVALDFLIIAFSIFLVVKAVNKLRSSLEKKEEEAAEETPAVPTETELLTEIRDLLKKNEK
ncbi:MAG: large-conductance mechanosensitive channel protein MscL [Anaerovoracaceae bacterium]|nr:large-conductance mechanosensitive channel protein MscL [Bacillota bacterium]MDY3953938.1 large-conductance mechanosensitive channel protein MscL [Anaerovoracaceae bacterium]